MRRSAATIVCRSPKHAGKTVNIALVSRTEDGWIPIRAENVTGSNPRLRGMAGGPGNVTSQLVVAEGDGNWTPFTRLFASVSTSGRPTHSRYTFTCPRCGRAVRVVDENLDRAMTVATRRDVWRIDLHTLAAILRSA